MRSVNVTSTQNSKMATGPFTTSFPSSSRSETPAASNTRQSNPSLLASTTKKPDDKYYNYSAAGHFANACLKPKVYKGVDLSELKKRTDGNNTSLKSENDYA